MAGHTQGLAETSNLGGSGKEPRNTTGEGLRRHSQKRRGLMIVSRLDLTEEAAQAFKGTGRQATRHTEEIEEVA